MGSPKVSLPTLMTLLRRYVTRHSFGDNFTVILIELRRGGVSGYNWYDAAVWQIKCNYTPSNNVQVLRSIISEKFKRETISSIKEIKEYAKTRYHKEIKGKRWRIEGVNWYLKLCIAIYRHYPNVTWNMTQPNYQVLSVHKKVLKRAVKRHHLQRLV